MIETIIEFIAWLWKCFYFGLPGGLANGAPVFCSKIKFLNYPVDFGKKWKGKPIFGKNKTFRGFFFGILTAIVIVYIQRFLYTNHSYFQNIAFLDYTQYNMPLFGFLIGFGVLFGDLVKSFIKRRLNIPPGKSWIPWDQLDASFGVLVVLAPYYIPPWDFIVFILIAAPIFMISVNPFFYYVGLRKTKR